MTLDKNSRTAGMQLFASANVTRTFACDAELDTESAATFFQERGVSQVLACGAALVSGFQTGHTLQRG